ncbi:hypothetical protein IWC96_13140 [Brevundimonas sp. BAL450]|uniref:Uncharacterized protein n=1 Tax=Brevundimonas abyssalis TAR-001 TaxID=1391729 RepID=A0A8E0TRR7_9CAUL|nr:MULTISPECIES: hypothetical protein [Brevundimonas]MBG7616216.1 hypothetical protein [Brevundimonas sp. BAL450]GAD59545.1 hypothetical protein MBEBAB_1795 [Brevundimonas abyssalis TAR-001]
MAQSRKADERYLDKDERELCERARQPALREMKQDELRDLAKRLRERRNRARDIARDQRRSASRGGKPTEGETGSDRKKALLSAGMKRVNRELDRRRAGDRGKAATANLKRALKRKTANQWSGPAYRNADEGLNPTPNTGIAPSGALNAEGQRPVLERSRKVR